MPHSITPTAPHFYRICILNKRTNHLFYGENVASESKLEELLSQYRNGEHIIIKNYLNNGYTLDEFDIGCDILKMHF